MMASEKYIIKSVSGGPDGSVNEKGETGGFWQIGTTESTGFGFDAKYNVTPKVGDTITLHYAGNSVLGGLIRGLDLNGKKVFYKTDADRERERVEWLADNEKKKQERFKKNVAQMDADYEALPQVFKNRIDKFRSAKPDFRVEYEDYELFCCKEAVKIAEALKTVEAIKNFHSLPGEEQTALVEISHDHSGNTFGTSCRLAFLYIAHPEFVEKEHGALAPLVGSKAYTG